jgi:hypothetical protein
MATPHLLGIPGELRNMIYKYALGEAPGGLSLVKARDRRAWTQPEPLGYNQLKYVCRQLYYETADFELRHNAVNFRKRFRAGLTEDKVTFVKNVDLFLSKVANRPIQPTHVNLYFDKRYIYDSCWDRMSWTNFRIFSGPTVIRGSRIGRGPQAKLLMEVIDDLCSSYPELQIRFVFHDIKWPNPRPSEILDFIGYGLKLGRVYRDHKSHMISSDRKEAITPRQKLLRLARETRGEFEAWMWATWGTRTTLSRPALGNLLDEGFECRAPNLRFFPAVNPTDSTKTLSGRFCPALNLIRVHVGCLRKELKLVSSS